MVHDGSFAREVVKPWGREVLLSPADAPYAGKLLFVSAGHRLSLQWHDQKDETISLVSGTATLVLESDDGRMLQIDMRPAVGYRVLPCRTHRLLAISDCVFVEASTPETGSTFRLEDDYGREDETEAARTSGRGALPA